VADNTPDTLTPTERLQLANQHEILEKLDPDNKEYHAKCREILTSGFTLLYPQVFQEINEELDQAACKFVYDVLDMHRDLIQSYDALTDKAGIDLADVRFRGFDGNNEGELYRFISFLQKHGLWKETLANCGLNTHAQSVPRYRKMLEQHKAIRDQFDPLGKSHDLTADEIKQVVFWKFQGVAA
jgi:uncharacterized protein YfbU (UPF0304 family)